MSYAHDASNPVIPNAGALGLETLTASAAVQGSYLVLEPIDVKRIYFRVTTAISATTDPAVKFWYGATIDSNSSATAIGVLTIPTGTAAGTVVYKDVNVPVAAGQFIILEHTVQASSTGIGMYGFSFNPDPEYKADNSAFLASA